MRSSMRRAPTLGGIVVRFDAVEGDAFAVPKIHGIKEAVVYAYSAAAFQELGRLYAQEVSAGNVGENLTIDSLDESKFMIGDEYKVGGTRLRVSGPRYPCNRLNFCFQRENAQELFVAFRKPGVYFEVLSEGHVHMGDELTLVKSAGGNVSVLEMYDNLTALKDLVAGRRSHDDIRRICEKMMENYLIPAFLRERFQKFL